MATITLTSEEQTINLVTEGSVSLSASNGKSAYQSYRDTTADNPILTEAQWVASLDEVSSTTSTDITGLLKGNGSVVSAATAGTDYIAPNTDATLDDLTVTSLRGAAGVKAQLQFPDFTTYGTNRFIGTGTGATGFNLTELYDGAGNRIGYVYCDATGGMSFANERSGVLKFLSNGVDRLTVYSGGGAYLGNNPSDPGAFNLKVQGTVEAGDGLIYTPTTLANWTSSADPGMVKDALDQLASRTKTLETSGGGGGGTNGWSPVFAVVSDGERRVLQVADWQGGTGTKPATGLYVGTAGLEALIANGVDVRGATGVAGATGTAGPNTVTTSTTTNITGLLKGNGSAVSAATAGTDYVATNDSRLHDQSHAITSASDHTAGNWKVFHSNATGQIVELPLGADGTFLKSNGASLAPSFATPAGGGGSSITGTGFAYVRSGGDDSSGTIGNPGLPYLTAQAAWDDGARNLDLGSGSYTVTHYSTSPEGGADETVRVVGLGKDSSTLTIEWSGTPATEESPAGKMPYHMRLISDHSVALTVNLSGSNAHSGDNNGGSAPEFEFWHCYIAAFSTNPGYGSGSGTSGGTSGGAVRWCEVQSGFGGANAIDFYATLEGDAFKGGLLASNIVHGGSTVDASLTTLLARVPQETYMRTTEFTDSTGTVSDVTGLSCSVAENEKILIEIVGFRAGGAAGSGLRISFSGPNSPSDVKYTLEHWNAVNTGRTVAAATSFNTVLTQADGSIDYLPVRVTLTLINGPNADTVQFRAASENSGTSINLLKGLTMRVHRIP